MRINGHVEPHVEPVLHEPAGFAHPMPAEIVMLPLAQLLPSQNNPRKSMDAIGLNELMGSIQAHGIQVPLLVRDEPGLDNDADIEDQSYEIISGHRRHKAAELAGLIEVPCIVRQMSDAEAREIQIVENLQREDLPPLEEADAYQALLMNLGTVSSVAARVGKPIEYVTRRLKLCSLLLFSRDALRLQIITIDHAMLLCKLAAAEQEQALRYVLDRNAAQKVTTQSMIDNGVARRADKTRSWGYWEPQSVLDLKGYIEREIKLALKSAPWDLADVLLVPTAGACTTCPKNTACNDALFGDLAIEEARCMDSACFNAKREAIVQRGLDAAKLAGKNAVRVSWARSTVKPKWAKDGSGPDLSGIFKCGQWVEAKKGSCLTTGPAITVDYDSYDAKKTPGVMLLVCVAAGCKAHPKDWEKAASSPKANGGYDAKAEAEQLRQKRVAVKIEKELRLDLASKAIVATNKLNLPALRVLLTARYEHVREEIVEIYPAAKAAIESPIESLTFAKLISALFIAANIHISSWNGVESGRKEFVAAMKVLGVDASKAWSSPKVPPAEKPVVKRAAKKAVRK